MPMGPRTCWKSCGTLLKTLSFRGCSQIPSTAWQKLRGASWTNSREANFFACLVLQIWLRCLARSDRRGVFFSRMLRAIVTAVSLITFENIGAVYPHRPLVHSRCFSRDTSADGAADLLEVLRNSPVKTLSFRGCREIPSTAWQRVPSGAWPALRDAPGIPEDELSRIAFGGAADGSFCRGRLVLAPDSGRTSEPWVET